jgi:hypothetical protein
MGGGIQIFVQNLSLKTWRNKKTSEAKNYTKI